MNDNDALPTGTGSEADTIPAELIELGDDVEAHHYALVMTVLQECLNGSRPEDAVALVALRCGEDPRFLRSLVVDRLRSQLPNTDNRL